MCGMVMEQAEGTQGNGMTALEWRKSKNWSQLILKRKRQSVVEYSQLRRTK